MTTDLLNKRCLHHWVLSSSESTIGVCRSCGRRRRFEPQAPETENPAAFTRSEVLSREALLTLTDGLVEEYARLSTATVAPWRLG